MSGFSPTNAVQSTALNITPDYIPAMMTAEQFFPALDAQVTEVVVINSPAPVAGTGIVGVRVSSFGMIGITFVNLTNTPLQPAAGAYLVAIIR